MILVGFALELIPVVPDERNALFAGLDCLVAFLGSREGRIQVGLVSVPITMQCKDKCIEGGNSCIISSITFLQWYISMKSLSSVDGHQYNV